MSAAYQRVAGIALGAVTFAVSRWTSPRPNRERTVNPPTRLRRRAAAPRGCLRARRPRPGGQLVFSGPLCSVCVVLPITGRLLVIPVFHAHGKHVDPRRGRSRGGRGRQPLALSANDDRLRSGSRLRHRRGSPCCPVAFGGRVTPLHGRRIAGAGSHSARAAPGRIARERGLNSATGFEPGESKGGRPAPFPSGAQGRGRSTRSTVCGHNPVAGRQGLGSWSRDRPRPARTRHGAESTTGRHCSGSAPPRRPAPPPGCCTPPPADRASGARPDRDPPGVRHQRQPTPPRPSIQHLPAVTQGHGHSSHRDHRVLKPKKPNGPCAGVPIPPGSA